MDGGGRGVDCFVLQVTQFEDLNNFSTDCRLRPKQLKREQSLELR